MKKILAFLIILPCWYPGLLTAQSEWIVQLKEGQDETLLSTGWAKSNYRANPVLDIKNIAPHFNILRLRSSGAIQKKDILSNPAVAFAELNLPLETRATPNDPFVPQQWHLNNISANKAWDSSQGGLSFNKDTIVIGVIDHGFLTSHEDLKNRIWQNRAEIPGNNIDDDNNGHKDDVYGLSLKYKNENHQIDNGIDGPSNHGTSVAGLIGGEVNNQKGIAGMMWTTKLMLGSFSANATISDLIEQFNYMLDQRIKYNQSNGKQGAYVVAINYSGGVSFAFAKDYPIWCGMYDIMGAAGIVNCGATANRYVDVDDEGDMPSTCPSDFLVTVTNTGKDNKRIYNAGFGLEHIDLGAPGDGLYSTHSSSLNGYGILSGTSAATPVVAGAMGLIYSYPCKEWADYQKANPADAARLAKRALLAGVDKNSDLAGKTVSGGRLNIARSLDTLKKYACNRIITSIKDNIRINSIHPNPAISHLNIILESATAHPYNIEIVDPVGRLLYRQEKVQINGQYQLTLPELHNGLYIIKLTQKNAQASKRFVIQN